MSDKGREGSKISKNGWHHLWTAPKYNVHSSPFSHFSIVFLYISSIVKESSKPHQAVGASEKWGGKKRNIIFRGLKIRGPHCPSSRWKFHFTMVYYWRKSRHIFWPSVKYFSICRVSMLVKELLYIVNKLL